MVSARVLSPTLIATNKVFPTGGVILPMQRLYTKIRPK